MKNILRLLNTIRFLKFSQILWRVNYRFFPNITWLFVKGKKLDFNKIEQNIRTTVSFIPSHQSYCGEFTFSFLNLEMKPTSWNDNQIQKLWNYNLHYFDYLNQENFEDHSLIGKWVKDNSVGDGNGWEPYPTSLRIVNIVKYQLSNSLLNENELESLYTQAYFLYANIEYHILGNHLFENAKALLVAGLFFGDEKLYRKGLDILEVEINEQILGDGSHFELSPMYHCIVLEGMLDIVNIHNSYYRSYPLEWNDKIEMMLDFLQAIVHPDGDIVCFNDSTFGIAKTPKLISEYAGKLGFKCDYEIRNHYLDSGLVRYGVDNHQIYIDAGRIGPDYLPGHAHADNLTFELSLFGKRVIVDKGISTYESSPERLLERSTKSHNTVLVDGLNQSDVWSSFRVARRVYPINIATNKLDDGFNFTGTYTGNKHIRNISWMNKEIRIHDQVSNIDRIAESFIHFHPSVEIKREEKGYCGTIEKKKIFKLIVNSESKHQLSSYEYCEGFNKKTSAKRLKIFVNNEKIHNFDIVLEIL